MRWYRYDSFKTEIKVKVLDNSKPSDLYIEKDKKKYKGVSENGGKYYVKVDNKDYEIISDAYVIIDGLRYALQGGTDYTNGAHGSKLLEPAKYSNGNAVEPKSPTKDNRKVEWTNVPKYDTSYPVSDKKNGCGQSNHTEDRILDRRGIHRGIHAYNNR